jgi:hypothetical protein
VTFHDVKNCVSEEIMASETNRQSTDIERDLRELALIDRIIGLEAEVARLSIEAGVKDIRILQKSRPWRVGRIVLMPVVLVRKIFSK